MDALEILREMHVEAKAAFQKIGAASPADRGALWDDLQPKLELHERIEEQFVYDPVASEMGGTDPTLGSWEREHETQVKEADAVMTDIDQLGSGDADWLGRVNALASTLARHIQHEEDDIWPRIRTAWGDERLAEAGRQVGAAKSAAEAGASISAAIEDAKGTAT